MTFGQFTLCSSPCVFPVTCMHIQSQNITCYNTIIAGLIAYIPFQHRMVYIHNYLVQCIFQQQGNSKGEEVGGVISDNSRTCSYTETDRTEKRACYTTDWEVKFKVLTYILETRIFRYKRDSWFIDIFIDKKVEHSNSVIIITIFELPHLTLALITTLTSTKCPRGTGSGILERQRSLSS